MPRPSPNAFFAGAPPAPRPFNPRHWFWVVGNSTTQVYSSKLGDFVNVNNAQYQTWLAAGNLPTKINSEQELGRTLGRHFEIIARPVPAQILDGFQNDLADAAERIFRVLLAPNKLNLENRIRACERALGLSTAPDLTAQQLKQLLKSMA